MLGKKNAGARDAFTCKIHRSGSSWVHLSIPRRKLPEKGKNSRGTTVTRGADNRSAVGGGKRSRKSLTGAVKTLADKRATKQDDGNLRVHGADSRNLQ